MWQTIFKKRRNEIVGFLTALILIGTAYIVEILRSGPNRADLWIAALLWVPVALGAFFVFHLFNHSRSADDLQNAIRQLNTLCRNYDPTFEWLLSDAQLMEIERNTKFGQVWLISPDASLDVGNPGHFGPIVASNAARGVDYVYFTPNTNTVHLKLPALRRLFERKKGQLEIVLLEESEFRRNTVTYIAIYNPLMEGSEMPSVYLELPVEQRGYWIKVTDRAAQDMVGRFSILRELDPGAGRKPAHRV